MKTKMRRRGGEAADEKGRERPAKHHEQMEDLDYAKEVGPVRGEHGKATAGRSPRKAGGGVGADTKPFSSAKGGEKPAGRHTMTSD
jgi:hypothetical protein